MSATYPGNTGVVEAMGVYNGTSIDNYRGNLDLGTLISAVGATTTQVSADQTNWNHRGLVAALNVTSVGTGSITLTIDIKDTVGGFYYAYTSFTAVTTLGLTTYQLYPGLPGAGVQANAVLGRTYRVRVVANNANPTTYTVGGSLIL